ncbi:MAG: RNA polymerase sigma factor [Myxococcales bacterium]|nr:RNA polymerase sigma factor [Myxococcales bacterium]
MAIDPELFDRCRRADALAWRRLYRDYAGRVFRWAVLRGLRAMEAEDAAQEVLAIAYRRIGQCAAAGAFDTWLYQITRRVVANARRKVWWRRVFAVERVPEPAFVDGPGPELELAVRACLARLPADQAEVLLLADVEGYTREEVADMIGRPPGTVASRLRLGREAFRGLWADLRPDGAASPLAVEEP